MEDEHTNVLNLLFRLILPTTVPGALVIAFRFWPEVTLKHLWLRVSGGKGGRGVEEP